MRRRHSQEARENKIFVTELRILLMDLVCDAISAGAFSGPEWSRFRRRLTDSPSFDDVVLALRDCRPDEWPVIVPKTDLPDDGTFFVGCYVDEFAKKFESPPQPKSAETPHSAPKPIQPEKWPPDDLADDYKTAKWFEDNTTVTGTSLRKAVSDGKFLRTVGPKGKKRYSFTDAKAIWGGDIVHTERKSS